MPEEQVPVTFQPSGKTLRVLRGTILSEAAAGAGIDLQQPCGGEGTCRKCRVQITGAAEPCTVDQETFSPEEITAGWRLACQVAVEGPTTVLVPETSLRNAYHKILTHGVQTAISAVESPVHKQHVESLAYAVATDVGTTTLVSALMDLHTGNELAVTSRINSQTRFGDDVLSRIAHAQKGERQLAELGEMVIWAIDEMIGELCAEAGVERERIYDLTFSGNTAMEQLLCGLDTSSLGRMPFAPTIGPGLLLRAVDLGFHVHERATAYVLPVIGGFVGGDTVAGMLASGIADWQKPALFVDIGTNGEIVLCADGRLTAASTAAGPAFEGARISQGMRGCAGAIEKVVVDDRLRFQVIGNVPPVGICGSGLIDAAAELLRHGLLKPQGLLRTPDQLPGSILPDLWQRVVLHEGHVGFQLASAEETGHGRPIVLTQRDIRELQLAAGAIRAGIIILLRQAGLTPGDLDAVLIGGGFGNFIRRGNAQRIGLLPWNIDRERIHFLGNTSLAGARLAAISKSARQQAEDLARRTIHVDLSTDGEFQETFAEAMVFPGE
jgi:uncharacterized 2Fe-2S/4Fe-4S cluster protein (DUF4445 family)